MHDHDRETIREAKNREERELIRRAKEYDSSAFAEIYERHYQGIYNYLYYRVGDARLAEDLASEVFLKALEAIRSFTFRGIRLSSWLYRIAKNLVTDYYRLQPSQEDVLLKEGLIAAEGSPGEALEEGITQRRLWRALQGLTEEQRQVIILKFIDGLSNTEVAQIMGKSEGAIKSLQHRALAALGRLLEGEG